MENIIEFEKAGSEPLSDQDMVNLFMGLFRLVRRQYQEQINKLKKEIETLSNSEAGAKASDEEVYQVTLELKPTKATKLVQQSIRKSGVRPSAKASSHTR